MKYFLKGISMRRDLSKNNGEKTKPSNVIKNVIKKDLVYGLLKALYKEYPNYVSSSKLVDYQNILSDFSGITIPSIQRNDENSSKPEFLAEAALVQLTQYIEKQDDFENYRITIKGIELLNAIGLNKSSHNLKDSTRFLLSLTGLLTILTLTNILTSIYLKTKNINNTLEIFIAFLVLSVFVIVLALVVYSRAKK